MHRRRPYSLISNSYPLYYGYYGYYDYPAFTYAAFPGYVYPTLNTSPVEPPSQFTNRKKQRRQAAAGVVQSMMGSNGGTSARKSTAQPRPDIVVPPGGIGPIADPNENDVLCGRGGRINSHAGNRQFREVIQSRKTAYLAPTTKKLEKAHIAAAIVNDIRSMQPPGRFLKEDGKSGMWYDIGDAKAFKKTGQALREDAPDIRPEIDGGDKSVSQSPKGASASSSNQKKPKSPIPKTVNASTSPKRRNGNNTGTFDAHGPQLLPEARGNTVDQQGRAAMPPPFHINQQANPYLNSQGGGGQQGSSFQPRTIPIQAPQNVSADYIHDVQQQQALFTQQQEENAFGRPFHPPRSAIGSEGTMSTISGLTDPVRSTMSSGSGMNTNNNTNGTTRSPPRNGFAGARMNSRGSSGLHSHQSHDYQQHPKNNNINNSARFSSNETVSSHNMQMSLGGGDMMSMAGSLARSSSFPDMSSVMGGSDSWMNNNKGMMDSDSDLAQLRSVLSGGGASSKAGYGAGSSIMSITSGTSSSQWMMNADLDVRSMNMSDMSSGLNALDLA
mmetsp:Transcript_17701/g.43636  ORF Transcript_17701/g.43636 Transcript_17701/m.43636 type:complete len:555 (+) Transcript_17701:1464-3128(+)